MNTLVQFFTEHLAKILSKEAAIFIISVMPVLELRGGLIAASLLDVPYLKALVICILGNLVPIPFVLFFIEKLVLFLESNKHTERFARIFRSKVDKHKETIEKYNLFGLTLFVGIPLPGTGAWTGSIVAGLIHMNRRKAFLSIILGVLLAAAIMSVISYGILGTIIH